VFNTLEELVGQFNSGREEEVYALYHRYWLHTGQLVEVRLGVLEKQNFRNFIKKTQTSNNKEESHEIS
jgi:hypothetical protein